MWYTGVNSVAALSNTNIKGGEKMDLSKISEVVDVISHRDVNLFLDAGWVILNIHNTAYSTGDPKTTGQTEHFTLGWEGKEPKYPDLSIDYETHDFLDSE